MVCKLPKSSMSNKFWLWKIYRSYFVAYHIVYEEIILRPKGQPLPYKGVGKAIIELQKFFANGKIYT